MTDLQHFKSARTNGAPVAPSRDVFVTEAGRVRVLKSAQKRNKEREDRRTAAILHAAAKAKSA